MLREAAADDKVVSIKMTLYRVAKQSEVVEALIEAAENGKDVLVLVELKARFDEENNIEWSRRLESAGCNVIYGLNGYKVHSKLCLITRKDGEQVEYFTQIGTGNYNEKTARLVYRPVHDDAPPGDWAGGGGDFPGAGQGRDRAGESASCWWRPTACKTACWT